MFRLILLRLLESYFRHRWLYLLPIALMAVAMVGFLALVPAPYVAQGTVYVQKETLLSTLTSVRTNVFGRYVTPAEETVGELYQLMNSDGFMRAIIQQTDMEPLMNEGPKAVEQTLDQVRDSIWFRSLGNNLVEVNTKAEEARVSAQLANSTIETYTRWKTNISRDEGVAAQQFFQNLVDTYRAALETERSRLTDYLVAHPQPVRGDRPPVEEAQIAQLQAAVNLAEERLRDAEDKEEETQLALAQTESNIRQSYLVVDAPTVPLEPTRSKTELVVILALFLMVGGVFSVAGIVGGALLDQGLRYPVDIRYGLKLPVLATIPEAPEPTSRMHTTRSYTAEQTRYTTQPKLIPDLATHTTAQDVTGEPNNGTNGYDSHSNGSSGRSAQKTERANGKSANGATAQSGPESPAHDSSTGEDSNGNRLKQLFGQN